jgi:hypothetical protein
MTDEEIARGNIKHWDDYSVAGKDDVLAALAAARADERAKRDAAIAEFVKMRDHIGGCTDGGCVIKRPTGMHTNGGCKCPKDYIKMQRIARAAQDLVSALSAEDEAPSTSSPTNS